MTREELISLIKQHPLKSELYKVLNTTRRKYESLCKSLQINHDDHVLSNVKSEKWNSHKRELSLLRKETLMNAVSKETLISFIKKYKTLRQMKLNSNELDLIPGDVTLLMGYYKLKTGDFISKSELNKHVKSLEKETLAKSGRTTTFDSVDIKNRNLRIAKSHQAKRDVRILELSKTYTKDILLELIKGGPIKAKVGELRYNDFRELCKLQNIDYDLALDSRFVGSLKSEAEIEIKNYIRDNTSYVVRSDRSLIHPYELDIYIPELNLAIEYNGVYYHNANKVTPHHKDINYHVMKRKMCDRKGVKLLQIWDYEWESKKDLVLSKLNHALGINKTKPIYARKTQAVELSKEEASKYLNKNHIKGFVNTCKYNYGLIYEGNIVACLSYTKPNKAGVIELKRYSGEVFGGLQKLYKFANSKLPEHKSVVTQIDLDWSHPKDNQYVRDLGFNFIRETNSEMYIKVINGREFDIKPRTSMGWHIKDYYLNPDLTDVQSKHGYLDTWNQMDNPNIKDLLYLCDGYYTCVGSGIAILEKTLS